MSEKRELKQIAITVWRGAFERNGYLAHATLGCMYYHGMGFKTNHNTAAYWNRKSANGGHPDGQFQLGKQYLDGEGVPQNLKEAFKWFSEAAKTRHPEAESELGRMCEKNKDMVHTAYMAKRCLGLASSHGCVNSI